MAFGKKSAKEFPGVQLSTGSRHRAERGEKAVVAFQNSAFWNARSKHSSTLRQGQGQVSATATHLNPSPKQGQPGRLPHDNRKRGSAGAEPSRGELSKSCPFCYKSFLRNELCWSAERSCLVSLRVNK